jgi:hypothetical protein
LIYTKVNGRKKVIETKGDSLEKHEGKKVYNKDGVPHLGLEVGDLYIKRNCKHLKYQVLWSARQSTPLVF